MDGTFLKVQIFARVMGEEGETDKKEPGPSASCCLPGPVQHHLLTGLSRGPAGKKVMGFAESWP